MGGGQQLRRIQDEDEQRLRFVVVLCKTMIAAPELEVQVETILSGTLTARTSAQDGNGLQLRASEQVSLHAALFAPAAA